MNDYFYPSPPGIEAVKTAADLRRLGPLKLEETDWAQQFRALEVIAKELRGRAYFIDTVFDPWQTIRRSIARGNMQALMAEAPAALLDAFGGGGRQPDRLLQAIACPGFGRHLHVGTGGG